MTFESFAGLMYRIAGVIFFVFATVWLLNHWD
jgi:hypothetical protein